MYDLDDSDESNFDEMMQTSIGATQGKILFVYYTKTMKRLQLVLKTHGLVGCNL